MRPSTSTEPAGRRDDPGQHLEQRALARAVRPDDPEGLAVDELEVHVAERPEVVELLALEQVA